MDKRNCGFCIPCAQGKYDECEAVKELHPEIALENRISELESQLTAEREARQRAEALCIQQGKQLGSITEKLLAAEYRIKASQEQEPYGWFDEECNQMFFDRHERNPETEVAVYKQPIIRPEVEALQREIEQRELNAKQLIAAYEKVIGENAELTRKLAEQQAWRKSLVDMDNRGEPDSFIVDCLVVDQTDGAPELTKLIEEAKRQTVPEDVMKDAARYRWIRDAGATFYTDVGLPTEEKHHVCEFAMDAAIDAAML